MNNLPPISEDALRAHHALTSQLHQMASTVHQLVRERIAALHAAMRPRDHPTETEDQFVRRVLAGGQNPFPAGACLYDDLNNNTAYEHVWVGYGIGADCDQTVHYLGHYPLWEADGHSYTWKTAEIWCPSWVITAPDGPERYRRQTEDLITKLRADDDAQLAEIEACVAELRRGGQAPGPA